MSFGGALYVGMAKPVASHDVAAWFAAGIRAHFITGGLFATETGIWGAGNKVLELRQDRGLCTYRGWSVPRKAKKGMF